MKPLLTVTHKIMVPASSYDVMPDDEFVTDHNYESKNHLRSRILFLIVKSWQPKP